MEAVNYSTKSMVDDFGRVFFFKNKVYRAINPKREKYCIDLLKSDLFTVLTEKGLIPKTKISNFELDDFNLILEHEKLREIPQHEWSFEIFKAAAILVLDINDICNKHGYELKDAHTFNILFRGLEPVYVDIGSITQIQDGNWVALDEFIGVFYLPIQFYLQNEFYIFRKLVESNFYRLQTAPFQTYYSSSLCKLIKKKPYKYNLRIGSVVFKNVSINLHTLGIICRAINKIENIIFGGKLKLVKLSCELHSKEWIKNTILNSTIKCKNTEWSGYHEQNYGLKENTVIPSRFEQIINLINDLCSKDEIDSIIDIAGNEGIMSKLIYLKTSIKNIVLIDYDALAIDSAYSNFKELNTEGRVSIALLNFIFTLNIEDTAKRYRSDIVLALAVTHHLILTQEYSIEVIFERLKMFSNKYVVVEFMPLGLWSIHTKQGPKPPQWYNLEWFNEKFQQYFQLIEMRKIEENRIVFLGCKK
ncbi:hypothetical protein ACS5NO_03605 [Larkinella sp. GY13]|uniref:hypothetical protein n=1 Tax=Larkinella sp. GY13 TaxID=3453720 RepID=UPI003EEEEAB3